MTPTEFAALKRQETQPPEEGETAGAVILFAYGVLVNQGGVDFNRLMGIYIAIFFVVSQVVSLILFKQVPDDRILVGGGFIVAGGLLILLMT